jgi:catechol 2,3-dioxygenase-like lactoylglutathione lyase family enzyme
MAVMGLGHFGYYVKDIAVMKDFWGNFMGMTLTKSSEGAAFYSADPEGVDHEIAIMQGRPEADDAHLIQQISLRVESLDNVRDFKRRAIAKGYTIDRLVTHASAIGLYFRDPEGNRVETFWLTGLPSWAMISVPINIDRPDDEVMADVRHVWDVCKHVEMGVSPEGELKEAIRKLSGGQPVASAATASV